MIGTVDTYYSRAEVSNSDLSALESYFMNREHLYDLQAAYRFGNLIDAMITEPARVDHLNLRVDYEQFTIAEWSTAKKMLNAFREDPFCMQLLKLSEGQNVVVKDMILDYEGFEFQLPARCKFDLLAKALRMGADIKSTTCTTTQQFVNSITHFNYDKQGAFYMDMAEIDKHMIIGISKSNYKIFKVPIVRGDELYNSGREKYLEWAFKYWYLFENF